MRRRILDRGDIIFIDFSPVVGREQALHRPALVLSVNAFNAAAGVALVLPITSRVRGNAFEVLLTGTKTTGVVLCQQAKTVDFIARPWRRIERAPEAIVNTALDIVREILA